MPPKAKKVKQNKIQVTEGEVQTGINTDRSMRNNIEQKVNFQTSLANVRTVTYSYDKPSKGYGMQASMAMSSNNGNTYSTSILNDNDIHQLGIGKRDIDMDELKALLG